jgi:hypothetical protein
MNCQPLALAHLAETTLAPPPHETEGSSTAITSAPANTGPASSAESVRDDAERWRTEQQTRAEREHQEREAEAEHQQREEEEREFERESQMILEINRRHVERRADRERFGNEAMDGPPAIVFAPTPAGRAAQLQAQARAALDPSLEINRRQFTLGSELTARQVSPEMASLQVLNGANPGQVIALDGETIRLGRNLIAIWSSLARRRWLSNPLSVNWPQAPLQCRGGRSRACRARRARGGAGWGRS